MKTITPLDGLWVGGFDTPDGWVVMYIDLQTADGKICGTVDLPLLGMKELPLEQLSIDKSQIGFVIDIAGQERTFDAKITDDTITGLGLSQRTSGLFQLVRASGTPSDFAPEDMGLYELAPNHDIYIGNIVGAFDIAYHDFKTRRISVLFPNSKARYFAGRELLIPFPTEVQIQLVRDDKGRTTKIRWQENEKPPILAPRIDFTCEDVEFNNGEVKLSGTIVFPLGIGPHPGVVIVHGSGPQTRYMVQIYAEGLARRGIATLIYDKRGTGRSDGHWESDYEYLADDALAAVKCLQEHQNVHPHQVGLCGASQAGWIIPITATDSDEVAFAVLLVSPTVSIAQQNMLNVEYSMRANGYSETDISEAVAHIDLFNQEICTGGKWKELQDSVAEGRRSSWAKYAWSIESPRTAESAASSRIQMERDPLSMLQQVTCPILAIFGGSDTVVPPTENMWLMEEALRDSGHQDFTLRVLPNSTHIFTHSKSGANADFPHTTHWLPEHFDIISDWILSRTHNAL